jgi:hypothetical protein
MGPDSKPRKVLSITSGWGDMYDIFPVKGDAYRVNAPHILALQLTPDARGKSSTKLEISVEEYLAKSKTFKHRAKGYRVGINFASQKVPVDPYFLGLWLGDGTSKWAEITNVDKTIIDEVYAVAKLAELSVSTYNYGRKGEATRYRVVSESRHNTILKGLKTLEVLENKHIPLPYKANDRKSRLKLLAGYLDADGSLSNGCFDYVSVSEKLAMDVAFVARSLGFACYVKPCRKSCQTGVIGTYYRGCISGETSSIPVRLIRKTAASRKQKKNVLRTGIRVSAAGKGYYSGFEIDGDGLFLLGDFTVTHNTHVTEVFAEIMFGTKTACIRIDCAEYQHSHEIAKLVGSPPGYLGHRETKPALYQELLDKYHTDNVKLSIVLFDEIEKASDSLWSILLGILDKATLTCGDNSKVNFQNTIIIMTSNLGAREMVEQDIGFGFETQEYTEAVQKQKALSAAKSKFSPEFMNRLSNIVVFKNQTEEQIRQVMELELEILSKRLRNQSLDKAFILDVSPAAKRTLMSEGYSKVYNSRYMKRTIERRITQPLAVLATSKQIESGSTVVVDDTGAPEFDFWSHPTEVPNRKWIDDTIPPKQGEV